MQEDLKLTSNDRKLNRKVMIAYSMDKDFKIKLYLKSAKYIICFASVWHVIFAIPEYKFIPIRMAGTALSFLIFYSLFHFLFATMISSYNSAARRNHLINKERFDELVLFTNEYMNNLLNKKKITQEEYDRFFKLNPHARIDK